ncbi:hypothetical protein H6P81_014918 [Aristolochia fimbriata]|uniref:PTB domain-containing engulfment adapter protein 1 n=1 Tax=Aristolochia fimbriata TaxID=158543 RepID=A0AAV7E4P9_ARIFI|nr:hypothetical protein H6P81_014918 [Aristolochia fimbriata]
MASVFVAAPKSPLQSRDEVYVAALPLRATRGPGQMLMSAAYSLNIWELQHYMVVIRTKAPQAQVFVFDFQPEDPENIFVALAALCRRQVPGVVLVRRLPKLPKTRCWFIGLSSADAVAQANEFNKCWKTELRIGVHDCRDYTGELVQHLTGEQKVLERLRSSSS